jgi:prepilin-type processing-associated H-X9-DG protein
MACISYYYTDGWNVEHAWDFTVDYAAGTSSLGLLGPYTKNEQINQCPSFRAESWGRPETGYSYNVSYIGGDASAWPPRLPTSIAAIETPAETASFADAAYWSTWPSPAIAATNYMRAPLDPFYAWIGPNIHFRHNGVANVDYCDGHAKASARPYNVSPNDKTLGDLSADDSAYDLR